ncbi:MAG TPA: hypothetical protein VLS90_13895, partial [Thermodesulfobacteriota bacterium]|nr:hypothetical protein [Thermodesulfobacteriota bacterium]
MLLSSIFGPDAGRIPIGAILGFTFFILLLGFPGRAHADNVIRGKACYIYGDNESLKAAREMTRSMALRDALESAGVFLSSRSAAEKFSL